MGATQSKGRQLSEDLEPQNVMTARGNEGKSSQTDGRSGVFNMFTRSLSSSKSSGTEMLLPLLNLDTFQHLLSFVPGTDLVKNGRRVNKDWKDAIDGAHIWITKLRRERNEEHPLEIELLKYDIDIKKLYILGTFRKNLLKNWEGKTKSDHWEIREGGDRIQMEPASSPPGSQPVPPQLGCINCWATSYGECSMKQVVDLVQNGCDAAWFDVIQPHMEISVWVANRHDCGTVYTLNVYLCGEDRQPLPADKCRHVYQRHRPQWAENDWEKYSYTFSSYGEGVRYVRFEHVGVDSQFWAGHYGPKMAAPSVRLLPRVSQAQAE